jgi:hypothetical protein
MSTDGAIFAFTTVLALSGWAATLVLQTRAKLPEAQAAAIWAKIKFEMDEGVRAQFSRFKPQSTDPMAEGLAEIEEIRRRAEAKGFRVAEAAPAKPETIQPITPIPDPDYSLDVIE